MKTWNGNLCDEIDNGEHEEEQTYTQEVRTISKFWRDLNLL